jgi:flagellar biosynthesis protein FlhA
LTIGDGLVAQVPSLLLSTAAGLMVTRVSSDNDMGGEVLAQLFASPKALAVTAGVLGIMGMIPGMPNLVFITIAAAAGWAAYWLSKRRRVEQQQQAAPPTVEKPPEPKELSWDDVTPVDLIGLEVGYRLIPLVDKNQGGQLMTRIKGVRKKLSQELGFLIPPVHIRDNLDLAPNAYRITMMGVIVGEAELQPDRDMAINPGQVFGNLQGINTKDPAFGLDAVWIEPTQREHAQSLGYTVVDVSTVAATHLSQLLQQHAAELLGHEEVQHLLDNLSKVAPKLVEDLVPKTLSLGAVVKVLQNLLREGVPIRDIRTIAETLAEHAPNSQDAGILTGAVRVSLGRSITQQISGTAKEIPVMTLDPSLEQLLHQTVSGDAQAAGMEPGLADRLLHSLAEQSQRQEAAGMTPVLLVSASIRALLARFVRPSIPNLHVLSFNEIPDNKQIKVTATVGVNANAA